MSRQGKERFGSFCWSAKRSSQWRMAPSAIRASRPSRPSISVGMRRAGTLFTTFRKTSSQRRAKASAQSADPPRARHFGAVVVRGVAHARLTSAPRSVHCRSTCRKTSDHSHDQQIIQRMLKTSPATIDAPDPTTETADFYQCACSWPFEHSGCRGSMLPKVGRWGKIVGGFSTASLDPNGH